MPGRLVGLLAAGALLAACAGSGGTAGGGATGAGATGGDATGGGATPGAPAAGASSGVGWAVVNVPEGPDAPHLEITGATITLGGAGAPASMSMSVDNLGQVEDHLDAASSTAAGRAQLAETTAAPTNQNDGETTGIIPIPVGTTTPFGGHTPWRILFTQPGSLAAGRVVPVLLYFSVATAVTLQVPVVSSPTNAPRSTPTP